MKNYSYKVYSKGGAYLTTWADVSSVCDFNQEINTAGGQLKVTLARNAGDYGEGTDVDFGYIVKVYVSDAETGDTPTLLFQGFIANYTPDYQTNRVDVTILTYGKELGDFIIQDQFAIDSLAETLWGSGGQFAYLYTVAYGGAPILSCSAAFTSGTGATSIKKIDVAGVLFSVSKYGYVDIVPNRLICKIKSGSTVLGTATIEPGTPIPYAISTGIGTFGFIFTEPVLVTGATSYTLELSIESDFGAEYEWIVNKPTGGANTIARRVYGLDGTTTVTFTNTDPSEIITGIIDRYIEQGGRISYDTDSIDLTGTLTTYTFNTSTTLEGIMKAMELAPAGWYWYVDYGTNLLHFHKKPTTITHTFALETHIQDMKVEKKIENLVNVIYFTGSGTNYWKFRNQSSIDKYGERSMKYVDQKVSNLATAEAIANSILEFRSEVELQTSLTILDSNASQYMGYDIESIRVGDVIAIRNISQTVGLSTFDYSKWDEAYWDYNIQNLASVEMQVMKLSYKEDIMVIDASTLPTDTNKRIEEINRSLEQSQTVNNPATPTEA